MFFMISSLLEPAVLRSGWLRSGFGSFRVL